MVSFFAVMFDLIFIFIILLNHSSQSYLYFSETEFIMTQVSSIDLDKAIQAVLDNLTGISELYPSQYEIISSILHNDNLFYTDSTNSGKTLPAVIYPEILKFLNSLGYNFPLNPKLLFITALNSLKLSLVNNVKALGIDCEAVTSENLESLLISTTSVLFISPETMKQPDVTKSLLLYRSSFVLKVVDEAHLGIGSFLFFN